jgi:hypothetical protein
LWKIVATWKCYFYVTDGWSVYPGFIPDGDQIISKTYMTRVEGENTRLRHYLARLHRKTLCYSKSEEMLKHSVRLLIHYLKFWRCTYPSSVTLRVFLLIKSFKETQYQLLEVVVVQFL